MINCAVCNKQLNQITYSHLKYHSMTLQDYKHSYPNHPIVSEEVGKKISDKAKGRERSQEHCDALSTALKMTFVNGRVGKSGTTGMKFTDETKKKMSDAQTGRKHSEETRKKMSEDRKNIIPLPETIEKQKETRRKTIEKMGHGYNKGKSYSEEAKKNISDAAKNRSPDVVKQKVDAMHKARRGQIETPEQRERKSEARSKYMSENPSKCRETNPEKEFKNFLDDNNITYIQQYRINGFRHPYDFYLPNSNLIVEIDGPQHWKGAVYGTKGKSEQEKEEIFSNHLRKDAEENYIAGSNGYKIARIMVNKSLNDTTYGTFFEQLEVQNFKLE